MERDYVKMFNDYAKLISTKPSPKSKNHENKKQLERRFYMLKKGLNTTIISGIFSHSSLSTAKTFSNLITISARQWKQ